MKGSPSQTEPVADVTLFLEGTYPYVLGGVSSWVQQIITGLPELTFSLLYIGAKQDPKAKQHYQLPKNVLSLKEVYLHTELSKREQRRRRIPAELRIALYDVLGKFYLAKTGEDDWRILPGGFVRIAEGTDSQAVHLQKGGRTADAWVLSEGPVGEATLLPSPDTITKVGSSPDDGISPRRTFSQYISTRPDRVAAPFWKRLWT